ncbi:MAG: LysR family transcriptional regulator substrate-binding protein, partial [Ilumatobacteraceae bacterium]
MERARRVLQEIDDIVSDMASIDDDVAGDARLGVIGTTARWLMPQFLAAVASNHPRVHLIVSEGSTTTIVPGVLSGHLNGAIIHLPIDDPELVVEPLFAEDLFLLVRADHDLAGRDELSLGELARYPLLLPPKGAALRRVLDRAAASVDVTLRAQAEIDGVRLLASLAFDGYGAAIVPATAAPRRIGGDFTRIQVPELPRRVV